MARQIVSNSFHSSLCGVLAGSGALDKSEPQEADRIVEDHPNGIDVDERIVFLDDRECHSKRPDVPLDPVLALLIALGCRDVNNRLVIACPPLAASQTAAAPHRN